MHNYFQYAGNWQATTVPGEFLSSETDAVMQNAADSGAKLDFPYNGERIELTYSTGPDRWHLGCNDRWAAGTGYGQR